jgi:ABC-2 type transport system permease protein
MCFSKKIVRALILKELKDYCKNPFVLIVLFLPIFTNMLYFNTYSNSKLRIIMCINYGIIFSGLFLPSYLITEEKDKRTLDSLMLFSVNSYEFLIGKLLPCTLFSLIANMISLFMFKLNFISYLQVTFLIFISLVSIILIGTLIGFKCRNQSEAMIYSVIIIALLYIMPLAGNLNLVMSKISSIIGISNMDLIIEDILNGKGLFCSAYSLLVMAFWAIFPILIFSYIYKFEKLE